MYRTKKDVDKHVEGLMYKLTPKDFKTRAYSIAHLYYEVGDYKSCQKYVEQFITQKSDHAAAYKLLGQAFQKLGEKEKALEQYKTSFDINPNQTTIILDVCDLLADEEVAIDSGRAKYWCDKAQANFPNHPITYRLRERLLTATDPDPEALVALLKGEIESRPNDAVLHARLLKHYLKCNKHKEAFEHSCNIEFEKNIFSNNYAWYETLSEILRYNPLKGNEWLNQLLLLTVREKLCNLSLSESPIGSGKSLLECCEHLHAYDQAIQSVVKYGSPSGFGEFHAVLLNHHQGQLVFHAATYLLKKAKKDQLNWIEAKKLSAPLMLLAWQTIPADTKVNWLTHAPDKQRNALHRWYIEGSYRCSQAGHYLQAVSQDKSQVLLDQISQLCSGSHWKDKLYEKIFTAPDHLNKIKQSFLASNAFKLPILKLPRKKEIQTYDDDAQREHPNSLHHFVWILLNYKNYPDFKFTLFDMLTQSMTSCGPETLNKLDVMAFLYSTTLTTQKQRDNKMNYRSTEKLMLPANITDLLCTLPQMKWWDCAYKLSQNELGVEYTDIRSTLSRGIEVVRCIDNHGLDPELLTILGRIFSEQAKTATSVEEKTNFELRACLYYSSAIPLLEKLKNKVVFKVAEKRMFDYIHDEIETKELNNLLEESKLYVALNYLNDGEYEKVINILSCLKSPQALYHLSDTYKRAAMDEKKISKTKENETKFIILLEKAKKYAYKALDELKEIEMYKNKSLYSDIQALIEEIELHLNKIDPDLSPSAQNYASSDENMSDLGLMRSKHTIYRNVSSTPKQLSRQNLNYNTTAYRTATDTHILDSTQMDSIYLERIEKQIKHLQKRDASFSEFKEQTKDWFEENRKLGSQIISTINSNIESTKEQFKLLKISLDQVKEQIDEYRMECKDVLELKKQITELKKEVNKLKKSSSEQTLDENDLYMGEEYRSNDNTFGTQLPFPTPQVMPPFAQRLMPPFSVPSNPYQLYGQNFYNLYNQYSQFAQPTAVPGAPPIFDPSRAPVNYPGVYPTPDQMYLDQSHLVPTSVPAVPTVPTVPVPTISTAPAPAAIPTSKSVVKVKETSKSLPVNVVITSSDPLPTCTTTPVPVLSVTIPQKHIKPSPHNYQIPMPVTTENKVTPPVFSFPSSNKSLTSTTSNSSTWNAKSIFMKAQQPSTLSTLGTNLLKNNDDSKNVVDGVFPGSSPNTSLNKSRTLSERSNTSIENYDPCPDFKPIIPLPAEVKVTTGEEDEVAIFSSRAKLFRFVDKQWKERGIGDMKLLKHKVTGKVRVLMRREQVHKICANHIILPEMEINPMKNESKAYFWVANDFAEETVILEKFCIRFKTADIAKEFYEAFEKARKEASQNLASIQTNKTANEKEDNNKISTPVIDNVLDTQSQKTVVGGFTFTSKPSFKLATSNSNNDTKIIPQVPVSKVNVFSGLTFKTATSSPFSNLLNVTTNVNNTIRTPEKVPESSKLNSSDTVDEFVPTAEFKPVVPLPALIEQRTGEEDEIILYEHRAKLLRFNAANKEWKERGLGNMKLLVHKDNNQKLRLLMRREQIMKVCCNHTVTKEMTFQKMPNMDKAVTWCAQDFSEGALVAETFCLRFKTVQACNDFMEAVKTALSKIGDDTKAAKEEQNAAKQNNQTGFGDKFKLKPGSWYCQTCYTNNLETFTKCACCETEKPQDDGPKTNDTDISSTSSDWGSKFKPKPGSWECKECYIRNEANVEVCNACNSPRDPNAKKTETKSASENAPKFNFGIPSTGIIGDSEKKTSDSKFTFGIPQSINISSTEPVVSSSLFNTNVSQKFSFGIPQNKSVKFGASIPTVLSTNTTIAKPTDNDAPLNFVVKKKDEESTTATPVKPALLPTPKVNVTPFGNESGTFEFSFKPKTPSKGKSPIKSPKDKKGDESDDNEYASEDEGHHIHFSPVIPMPDKIEVVTGEENEDELYNHRARLFRFSNGEWKERGTGVVKILKHKETGKIRVVMRREQVLKICLNHALVPDNMYKPKDERTWFFVANDFSEGEVLLQQFCIRFANKEIAMQFKDAIDKALQEKFGIVSNQTNDSQESDSEDVIFITEIQATSEEKEKAKELMLPENFYTYKNKEPCHGCRGCNDDDVKPESEQNDTGTQALKPLPKPDSMTTPLKTSIFNFQSPNNSLYGTPSNLNNTVDTTIFRTPLSTNGSNTNGSSNTSTNSSIVGNDSTDKENTLTQSSPNPIKPVPFGSGGSGGQLSSLSSILAAPKLNTVNSPVNSNGSSAPKSVFGSTEPKSVFGENKSVFGESKPLFSQSSGKPILGFNVQPNETDTHSTEVKSIFSPDVKPSVNLFSGTSGGNIFGPAALKISQSTGIFGPSGTFKFGTTPANQDTSKSIFGQASDKNADLNIKSDITSNKTDSDSSEKFVFGKLAQPQESVKTWLGTVSSDMPTTFETKNNADIRINEEKKTLPAASAELEKKPLFGSDNALTFEALSSTVPGFGTQKKNDFQWEGAGQQLFTTSSNRESADKSKDGADDSGAGVTVEDEYDPHYEPIVPLPDKIIVTTGEEDEEKLFGERCKLYRFDEKTREWKERGVGEMKILYHPERNSYRLLLRREQVHKAVLNMLLFMDLELLPMKNSDRAWTWAGRNYAEIAGEQETLAVRFKSVDLATAFRNKVMECVRKLQVAAAEAIRKEKEAKETQFESIAPLRLPKHLGESARAEASFQPSTAKEPSSVVEEPENNQNGLQKSQNSDESKQVHFEEPEEDHGDYEEVDYEHDYDHNEDSDGYYNEEDEESSVYYPCKAIIKQGDTETVCDMTHVHVSFDQEIDSPKILVTDSNTGEILADMLIHTDTEFQLSDDTCSWSGMDYTTNVTVEKTLTITFPDSHTAMEFYDSCETSKAATFASTDPES
ncbi:unnamed protein product, partial [Brenthis ino]